MVLRDNDSVQYPFPLSSPAVKKKIKIAIDGYSSCGKSTLAKALAKKLGYAYVDSGAMYRAVTVYVLRNKLAPMGEVDEAALTAQLNHVTIDFIHSNGQNLTRLNGEVIEDQIRSMAVSDLVSPVSAIPAVRKKLRQIQQEAARVGGVVMDGRDIGSAVLPGAEVKIFMTADPEIRTLRRFHELKALNKEAPVEEVRRNLLIRDTIDTQRAENPLIQVPDAHVLDNSELTEAEQLEIAYQWALTAIHAEEER